MTDDDCIFCQIVEGSTTADVVYENDEVLFFRDIEPQAAVHVLGVPKRHIASLAEVTADDYEVLGVLAGSIKRAAEKAGIAESGYRVVVNTGPDANPHVPHLHWHVMGGEKLGPLKS